MDHKLHQATVLTRSLRGAPLTVLFAMLMLRRSLGTAELETITGYNRKTVSNALNALRALGLTVNLSRYHGWQLTDKGYQLPLAGIDLMQAEPQTLSFPDSFEGEKLPLPPAAQRATLSLPDSFEGEKLPLDVTSSSPRRSSSFKDARVHVEKQLKNKQLLLNNGEGKKLPLPPGGAELVELLKNRCGTPPGSAHSAIAKACARDSPANVRVEILRWLAYCLSDSGTGINSPGVFIASRIADSIPCPSWFKPPKGGEIGEELRQAQPEACIWCGEPTTHTFLDEPICHECMTYQPQEDDSQCTA